VNKPPLVATSNFVLADTDTEILFVVGVPPVAERVKLPGERV
jgi:hypothetical protein